MYGNSIEKGAYCPQIAFQWGKAVLGGEANGAKLQSSNQYIEVAEVGREVEVL